MCATLCVCYLLDLNLLLSIATHVSHSRKCCLNTIEIRKPLSAETHTSPFRSHFGWALNTLRIWLYYTPISFIPIVVVAICLLAILNMSHQNLPLVKDVCTVIVRRNETKRITFSIRHIHTFLRIRTKRVLCICGCSVGFGYYCPVCVSIVKKELANHYKSD